MTKKRKEKRKARRARRRARRSAKKNTELHIVPTPPQLPVFNPNYIKWPPPRGSITKQSQILDGDYTDISRPTISNAGMQDFELSHIATLRPEIIAATELYPIYPDDATSGENLTSVGKLITFQYQSQQLKSAILKELASKISDENDTESNILSSFDERYKIVSSAQKELEQVNSVQKELRKILNFRRNLEQVIQLAGSNQIADLESFGLARNILPTVISVNELISRITGYNESQLNSFSNTKIFMTICSDIEQALSNGVVGNLSDEVDQDRVSDLHPTQVDVTHKVSFGIDTEILNSPFGQASQVLMVDPAKFERFQTTLPRDPYQRLLFSINFISKELLNSRYLFNLGKKTQTSINGNFYNELFGKPGRNIFEKVSGNKSLITISSMLDQQRNATILPFEDVYIQNNTGDSQLSNKYIPGKRYFVDSILDGIVANSPDLNTKPILDYASRTQAIFNDITSVLDDIQGLRNSYFLYSGGKIYKYLLSQVDTSTVGLIQENKTIKDQAVAIALFRKSWDDAKLKQMLFQYLVFLGVYLRKTNISQNQYVIFDTIANELGSTTKLNFLHNPSLDNSLVDPRTLTLTPISLENVSYIQPATMAQHLVVFASNIAKYVIGNQTLRRGNIVGSANQYTVNITEDNIVEFLTSPARNTSFIAKGTMVYDFFDFIQAISKITDTGFFSETGGTKFSKCLATNLVYIVFEMYLSLAKIFGFANFTASRPDYFTFLTNRTRVRGGIIVDWYKHAISRQKIQLLVGQNTGIAQGVKTEKIGKNNVFTDVLQIVGSNSFISQDNFIEFEYDRVSYRPRIANTATGVLSDLFLLYGNNIELNPVMLPLAGSKVYELYTKLWNDDWLYPAMIKGFISLLNNNIAGSIKQQVSVFTNPTNLQTIRGTKLRPEVENLRIFDQAMTEFTQIRGDVSDQPTSEDVSRFFEKIAPSPLKLQMLLTMFRDATFLPVGSSTETRKRVLSIGVPNGMVDSLNQSKLLTSINSSTTGKAFFTNQQGFESDIVKVNVYRRDLRFDSLVFKPKTYYFDTSLFINETAWGMLSSDLNVNAANNPNSFTFDEIVNMTTFNNYQNGTAFTPDLVISADSQAITTASGRAIPYGTNIPRNIRFEILRNTFQSYLLQYYVSLVTGMIIDEKTFAVNQDINSQQSIIVGTRFIQNVYNYLRSIGEPITSNNIKENLANPRISSQAKMLIELVNTASLSIDPGAIYTRLANNPLSFDRVFHIPETADAYEIDIEKTKLTRDGIKLLNSNKFNESLIRFGNSYYLPFTSMDDVAISDYFVDIEIVEFN